MSESCSAGFVLKKGQDLSEIRGELLHEGWMPVTTDLKMHDGTLEHNFGDAGELFRSGYPEVESCSGADANYCFFNYAKNRRCLRMETQGERRLKIIRWTEECIAGHRN